MTIVPTFEREDLPSPMQTGAQADIAAAGIPGEALQRFGQAGVDTAIDMIHAENYDWTATNTANFAINSAQKLDAAKQQAAKTGDYKGALTAFNTQLAADQAAILQSAPSQRAADAFTLHSKGTMLDLTRDANTQSNLDKLSGASYRNPAIADTNYGIGVGIIKGAQAAGIGGDKVDWQSRLDAWGKQNYGAVVRNQIDTDPQGALTALQGGKYDFALHSEDVEQFTRQAQVQIDRVQQKALMAQERALAMEQRQDMMAQRQLRQTQAANAANLIGAAIQGKTIDPGQLGDAVRSQAVTPEAATAVLRAQEGQDDPQTALHLYQQLGTGNLQANDISTAVSSHLIKGSTGVELMRGLNERDKSGENQAERMSFDTLKTALGGQAAEQGIDVMGAGKAQSAQLWAQAQGEWNRRVIINHEDPQAALADMIPRYSPKANLPTWLPAPQMGAITDVSQLPTIVQQTKAAFTAGAITQDQYQAQGQLLQRYQQFFDAKAQRDAAAKAARAPAKPGAAPPVLTPAQGDQ
jgi:hypothetical protein